MDFESGKVTCQRCGQYLGNYLTDDYFRLITTKYCPVCREIVNRENKRRWKHEKSRKARQEREKLKSDYEKVCRENEILRAKIRELEIQIRNRRSKDD